MNLRYVLVASSRAPAADRATLEVSADASVLIPGPYMLFAVRTVATRVGDVDVPSPARIVMVR